MYYDQMKTPPLSGIETRNKDKKPKANGNKKVTADDVVKARKSFKIQEADE
jgi:hypothetical protein